MNDYNQHKMVMKDFYLKKLCIRFKLFKIGYHWFFCKYCFTMMQAQLIS